MGFFSFWNISSRDSDDESLLVSTGSCVCRSGRNLLASMLAFTFSKLVFMNAHLDASPEDPVVGFCKLSGSSVEGAELCLVKLPFGSCLV